MKFRINYTLQGGIEDSFLLDGDSIEEMREMAESELTRRGGVDPWSEELIGVQWNASTLGGPVWLDAAKMIEEQPESVV